MEVITKNIVTEIKSISDDRTAVLLATDETLDRDNDIILSEGMEAKNFIGSGSILYGHDYRALPVGKPLDVYQQGKQTFIKVKFADAGTDNFIDAVVSLVEQGILKGVSIGFIGREWMFNEHGGRTFLKWELLEASLVTVPANPSARVAAKSFSADTQKKLFTKHLIFDYQNDISESRIKQIRETVNKMLLADSDESQVDEPTKKGQEIFCNVVSEFAKILRGV